MSWRDKLSVTGPGDDDRSDRRGPFVTCVNGSVKAQNSVPGSELSDPRLLLSSGTADQLIGPSTRSVDVPDLLADPQIATALGTRVVDQQVASQPERFDRHEDPGLAEAQREIAALLAGAYRRYSTIERVGNDQSPNSGDKELANSSSSSVHGVVP
jgi:hypothetical protein